MKKIILNALTAALLLFAFSMPVMAQDSVGLNYMVHGQNYGWSQGYISSPQTAGTVGQALHLEAIRIKSDQKPDLNIRYRAHVSDVGWMDYVGYDQVAGTEGQSRQLEALEIYLNGDDFNNYDVFYRAHVSNIGWQDWMKNGATAGTVGRGLPIEAIEIRLEPKGHTVHTWDGGTVTTQATCGQDGTITYTCSQCGETRSEVIPKTGEHSWDEGSVSGRVKTYTCTVCGETRTEELACAHEHTEIRNQKDANCSQEGYTGDTYCVDCGELISSGEATPKTEHDYLTKSVEASKEGPGYTEYICKICGESHKGDEVDYNPTPEQVYNDIIALKEDYPEGMHWTNDNTYQGNGGCHAFALLVSDAVFGYLPYRTHHDLNDLKVGDAVRINNDTHTVVILETYPDYVIITEGNFNSSIHWGRKLSRSQILESGSYVITRYPEE